MSDGVTQMYWEMGLNMLKASAGLMPPRGGRVRPAKCCTTCAAWKTTTAFGEYEPFCGRWGRCTDPCETCDEYQPVGGKNV